jgi:hypothetical protein
VGLNFIGPILDESALGDDQDRIGHMFLEPRKRKVDTNLGLAETLLVKQRCVFKLPHGFDCLHLLQECLVSRVEPRFSLEKKHRCRP